MCRQISTVTSFRDPHSLVSSKYMKSLKIQNKPRECLAELFRRFNVEKEPYPGPYKYDMYRARYTLLCNVLEMRLNKADIPTYMCTGPALAQKQIIYTLFYSLHQQTCLQDEVSNRANSEHIPPQGQEAVNIMWDLCEKMEEECLKMFELCANVFNECVQPSTNIGNLHDCIHNAAIKSTERFKEYYRTFLCVPPPDIGPVEQNY